MPSSRQAIQATNAPKPNGNYSHAVRSSDVLDLTGWMGNVPTGHFSSETLKRQIEQAVLNVKAGLVVACVGLGAVVRRRINMIAMKRVRKVDVVWTSIFEEPYPMSICGQICVLAKEGSRAEFSGVES